MGGWNAATRIGAGFLLAGAAAKTRVFLLGLLLPKTHGQARTEVSPLLSGLVVRVGVLAVARLAEAFPLGPILLAIGILTVFGGILYSLCETDLKTMLGHHNVSQLGYMLLGLGVGAGESALAYAVAHGLFKGLLFLCAGEAAEKSGVRSIAELSGRVPRPVAFRLAWGGLAIAGLPPLAGFAVKGLLGRGQPFWVKTVLLPFSLGTSASFSKLLQLFRGRGRGKFGGIAFLAAGLLPFGILGLFLFPKLRHLQGWGEAFSSRVWALAHIFFLRERLPPLPKLSVGRAFLFALLATLIISAIAAFV